MTDFAPAASRLLLGRLVPATLVGLGAGLFAFLPDWRVPALLLAASLLAAAAWWVLAAPARWWSCFAAATLLLPPLPLAWGNTGPHPALIFVVLGLWGGLIRASHWRLQHGALTITSLLFVSVLLLSVPLALVYSGPSVAAGSLIRVLLFSVAVFAFLDFAAGPSSRGTNSLDLLRRLYLLGIVAALIACLDFYFQLPPPSGFGEQYVWMPDRIVRRAQGFFYDAGMFGNLCAFFTLMIVLAALRPGLGRHLASQRALIAGGVLFSAALVFSFSRSSLLNLGAALGTALIIHRAELLRNRRWIAIPGVTIMLGLFLAALLFPVYTEWYLTRLWSTLFWIFSRPQDLLSGRLETWQALLDFLASHPQHLFLGIGFKTLPYSSFTGRPLIADNMYLSILVETGMVGLLAMMLWNAAIIRQGYRAMQSSNQNASFLGAWIFCFWIGQLFQMLSVDVLTYWRVLPLYLGVLALAVREADQAAAAGSAGR